MTIRFTIYTFLISDQTLSDTHTKPTERWFNDIHHALRSIKKVKQSQNRPAFWKKVTELYHCTNQYESTIGSNFTFVYFVLSFTKWLF